MEHMLREPPGAQGSRRRANPACERPTRGSGGDHQEEGAPRERQSAAPAVRVIPTSDSPGRPGPRQPPGRSTDKKQTRTHQNTNKTKGEARTAVCSSGPTDAGLPMTLM